VITSTRVRRIALRASGLLFLGTCLVIGASGVINVFARYGWITGVALLFAVGISVVVLEQLADRRSAAEMRARVAARDRVFNAFPTALALLANHLDDEQCWFDPHGACQNHSGEPTEGGGFQRWMAEARAFVLQHDPKEL
jgi:hypothetical protein